MGGVPGAKGTQVSEHTVCNGAGRVCRGCTIWVETGHVTKLTFLSCDGFGLTRMSTVRGQSEKCAF